MPAIGIPVLGRLLPPPAAPPPPSGGRSDDTALLPAFDRSPTNEPGRVAAVQRQLHNAQFLPRHMRCCEMQGRQLLTDRQDCMMLVHHTLLPT